MLGGETTASGKKVTEHTALNYVAWYACVNKIAKTMAALPVKTYERLPRGKRLANDHYLYPILHDRPCPEMTAFTWKYVSGVHVLNWGNAYSSIVRENGRVKELWLMPPWRVKPERANGKKVYRVQLPTGGERVLLNDEVLHIMGFSTDGMIGKSPALMFRESIAQGLAMEEYGARWFGNGGVPVGALTTENKLTDDARKNMKESWQDTYGGLSNAHKVALLEEGTKYQQIGSDPETAQMLESKVFGIQEMARILDIPLHKVQELTHATFTNIEEQNIDWLVDCITPHTVNWEQQFNSTLFLFSEMGKYFSEFLISGMLRGNSQQRAAYYQTMFNVGAYSQNMILERENENPIDGGDEHYVELNRIPISQAVKMEEPPKRAEQRALSVLTETRNRRAAKERTRIRKSFKPVFEDFVGRIARRERNDILAKAKKMLATRSVSDLSAWLEDFYRDLPDYIQKQARPAYEAFITEINRSAAEQAGVDAATKAELASWAKRYAEGLGTKYSRESLGELKGVLDILGDDPAADLEAYLTEREDTQPEKTWRHETVFIAGAVAGATWAAGGFTKERWVANANACPICQELDGVTTSISGSFVPSGTTLNADEEQGPVEIHRDIIHPPLHGACSCDIAPA
jgi:HK97 family phage portal protein